jgi:Family of unknown function (DUF6291)
MERDSMIIYRSFFEAIKELPKTNQAEVWNAVYELGLNGKYVELNGISKTIFTLIAPQIEANYKKFVNGSKPKTKQIESKPEAKEKQTRSKTEGNVNVNVNDNVNVIPSCEEFIAYAVSNVSDINTEEVRLKYESWKVNNWSTNVKGKEKPIKNWKSTLLNTLPYLGRIKPEELSLEQLQYNYVQKMKNYIDTKDYSNAD